MWTNGQWVSKQTSHEHLLILQFIINSGNLYLLVKYLWYEQYYHIHMFNKQIIDKLIIFTIVCKSNYELGIAMKKSFGCLLLSRRWNVTDRYWFYFCVTLWYEFTCKALLHVTTLYHRWCSSKKTAALYWLVTWAPPSLNTLWSSCLAHWEMCDDDL